MSREIKEVLKFNIQTVVIKKLKVSDLNGSTVFTLDSGGTWELYKRDDETLIENGVLTENNADVDNAGNPIKTISFTIDLRQTDDQDRGSYYLVIETVLTTAQTDVFRIPVELVDYRRKGAA